ncbi:M15 family metallopeptidase [Paenibacillus donghaensis]|uniref:Peptidase M15 n=1 Tax=Paenibacillus donghaensis TaxID=414771 RepID=A0A2Z2KU87_9BACL|nr:M15 family metallopeptidase [Paenibacillus donghaensis]ASA24581.1 peptidase M15 [Paenibacillus donghaensis]
MSRGTKILLLLVLVLAAGWAIGRYTSPAPAATDNSGTDISGNGGLQGKPPGTGGGEVAGEDPGAAATPRPGLKPEDIYIETDEPGSGEEGVVMVAAQPDNIAVLVNKQIKLPEDYEPTDLVYPDVRFIFKEKIEKRMMRSEAAAALKEMFAGAEADGIYLAGVSAYRSENTQRGLFNLYVERDGEEKARTYSAVPGYSEHQTGLSIDISGSDGKCAAESCFGGTPEAEWLAAHAAEYGYIIRYLEGKQAITGYMYEPWHVRYVGKDIAERVEASGLTLEEYYDVIPVSAQ